MKLTTTTPFAGEAPAVLARLRCGAGLEAAAVDPDHDRQPLGCRAGRRPDVEVQAVLARLVAEDHVVEDRPLHASRAELGGLPHALPVRGGLRLPPPEVAHGRCSRTGCRGRRARRTRSALRPGRSSSGPDPPSRHPRPASRPGPEPTPTHDRRTGTFDCSSRRFTETANGIPPGSGRARAAPSGGTPCRSRRRAGPPATRSRRSAQASGRRPGASRPRGAAASGSFRS